MGYISGERQDRTCSVASEDIPVLALAARKASSHLYIAMVATWSMIKRLNGVLCLIAKELYYSIDIDFLEIV